MSFSCYSHLQCLISVSCRRADNKCFSVPSNFTDRVKGLQKKAYNFFFGPMKNIFYTHSTLSVCLGCQKASMFLFSFTLCTPHIHTYTKVPLLVLHENAYKTTFRLSSLEKFSAGKTSPQPFMSHTSVTFLPSNHRLRDKAKNNLFFFFAIFGVRRNDSDIRDSNVCLFVRLGKVQNKHR